MFPLDVGHRVVHLCCYQLQWRNIVECLLGCQRCAPVVIIFYLKNNPLSLLDRLCLCSFSFSVFNFPPLSDSTDLVDFMSHNASALPGPPSKPEVTNVTRSSISLSWEPGPEAGSPVSSYVIEAFGYVCDLWPRACASSDPKLSWQ